MEKLTPKAKKEIIKLVGRFPSNVRVKAHRSECGKYCAEIITFPGCFTEADNFLELIEMVNDAIRTYFEVPKKYLSFMPEYLCPVKMAQHFNAFPATKQSERVLNFEKINEGIRC